MWERLARLAYPETAETMVVLAKDKFVDTLPEEDMRLHIRQNKPTTLRDALRDALRLAVELESYELASRQRPKLVRGAHLEGGPVHTPTSGASSSAHVLQQLVEAIGQCGREPRQKKADLM